MGNIKPLKQDVAKMVTLLDTDEDGLCVEDMALRALELAWEVYEAKAKFTVVGQVVRRNAVKLDLGNPEAGADKICLGNFGTEAAAKSAAMGSPRLIAGATMGLFWSAATKEQARMWVIPIHHGTPAKWYTQRKITAHQDALDAKATAAMKNEMERQYNQMLRSPEWALTEEDSNE